MTRGKRRRAIQARLKLRGISQVSIAEGNNVTEGAVSRTIKGDLTAPKVRRAIAYACGWQYEFLWPRDNRGGKSE